METGRKKHEDRLIKIFVELCNLLPTFNYKEGTQTITFEEAAQAASKGNGSDLDCFPAPQERQLFVSCLFCYISIVSVNSNSDDRCLRQMQEGAVGAAL